MLLAVAGQTQQQIEERTRRLATGEWSSFSPGERAAFAFARKQSTAPWSIGDKDVQSLVEHFGPERTADVIWWSCRCHFMTRVADAFQLPLEKENVFQPLAPPPQGAGQAPKPPAAPAKMP
jgi:alkylhydroperoxidase family enzyme